MHKTSFLQNKKELFFYIAFVLAAGFVVWRCRFGFAQNDECFYLAVPLRMYKGDALLVNEWHLSQLTAFLYYPVIKVFIDIKGSLDGIVMYVRYVYAFLHILSSMYIYRRLKRIDTMGAMAAALIFLLFTPNSMSTLYYFTIGIRCNTLCYVTVATAKKGAVTDYIFSGVLFAAAVLCCPYMVIEFAVLLLIFLYVNTAVKTNNKILKEIRSITLFTKKNFMLFIAGIAVLAAAFFVYLFRFVEPGKLLQSIKPMLIDYEHNETFLFKIVVYLGGMIKYNNIIACGLMAVLFAELIFRRRYTDKFYFISAAVIVVWLLIYVFLKYDTYMNYLMFPLACLTVFCVFLSEKPEIRYLFYTAYVPGIMYTFCLNLASNQGFAAVSMAFSVPTVVSAVIVVMYAKELSEKDSFVKGIVVAAVMLLFAVQLSTQTVLKYENIYQDEKIYRMSEKADYGIMKGIYMTSKNMENYNYAYDMVDRVNGAYDFDKILCISLRSWYYLIFDKEICGYSPWVASNDRELCEKLGYYYKINPEKMPEVVFNDTNSEYFLGWFMKTYPEYHYEKQGWVSILVK